MLFCFSGKGVRSVKVAEILREKQPKEYKELNPKKIDYKKSKEKKERFSEREIKELMSHSAYKRCGRAIRQIK